MSKLSDILRRASKIWTYFEDDSRRQLPDDGEIIYSKNNVCVHQTNSDGSCVHHPGYLNLRVQYVHDEILSSDASTVVLTWIPNSILRKNPKTVEDITPSTTPKKRKLSKSPSNDSQKSWSKRTSRRHSLQSIIGNEEDDLNPDEITEALKSMIIDSALHKPANGDQTGGGEKKENPNGLNPGSSPLETDSNGDDHRNKYLLDVKNCENLFSYSDAFDESNKSWRANAPSNCSNGRISPSGTSQNATPTHELYGRQLVYENACVKGIFCVDLKEMKSLRLFFSSTKKVNSGETNGDTVNGQLVVASRESQYKIFHFHHGGLDKLVSVLEEWDFLMGTNHKRNSSTDSDCVLKFWVCRPEVKVEECHPEEGSYQPLDEHTWRNSILNEFGQIEDDFALRKMVFFGGIGSDVQIEAWPFLLRRFDYASTYDERQLSVKEKEIQYQEITSRRESLDGEEMEAFWRNVQCTVEKDAPRTDRNNPFFAGENNQNVEVLKRILLNYAVYNPTMGYTQGMSDLLAPLLTKIQNESETFWCFVGLMQHTLFISSPKDFDMDANLSLLRELIRIMNAPFYGHLKSLPDALELLFTHRWILLCFKREFPEKEALKLWESCWAHYQTDYFHLFICLAIISIYGSDVINHEMRSDEILLHFSTLSMHMDGELVLRKARGLLYQFRLLPKIPCTLEQLCNLCGPGIWDSGHAPAVECVRNQNEMESFHQCTCFKRD